MSGLDRHHQVMLVLKGTQIEEDYSKALTSSGHTVTTVNSTQEARAAMRRDPCDVMVIDAAIETERDGLDLAHDVLQSASHPEIILLVTRPEVKQAVAFTKAGGFDYVAKPILGAQVLDLVRQAGRSRSPAESSSHDAEGFDDFLRSFMVSSVPQVQEMAALCRSVASRPEGTALIVGEPGAGKGVVTRIIHWLSAQARAPFVVLNVVDVDPSNLERTLFGTGNGDDGLLATAQGGTLVLREFGEVEPSIQAKFKKLLETRSYVPVGGGVPRSFHGRVLATSAWDTERLIRQHGFDAGLGYLLGSATITVPPLRDRAEDLPRITEAIFAQVANDASRPDLHLTPPALQLLFDHPWVGNLRELRNVLTRLALLCPDDEVDADALARALGFPSADARRSHSSGVTARVRAGSTIPRRSRSSSVPVPRISGIIAEVLDEPARAERDRIEGALEATDGHRERAAAILGMSRTTLWTRMRMLGIECDRFHTPKAKAQ